MGIDWRSPMSKFLLQSAKNAEVKKIFLTQKSFFLLKNNFFYSCSRITQERSRTILGALKDLFASFLTNFSKIKIITFQSCSAKFGRFFVGRLLMFFELKIYFYFLNTWTSFHDQHAQKHIHLIRAPRIKSKF